MAWWGIALALGPNYNLPLDAERERHALDGGRAARMALAPSTRAPRERPTSTPSPSATANGPSGDRKALDRAYADAMRELSRSAIPTTSTPPTLFAEALMDLRPVGPVDARRQAAARAREEIVATLERVLAKAPDHPGANHYYIHAVEASPHARARARQRRAASGR